MIAAIRFHFVWVTTALLGLVFVGLVYPNVPMPVLGVGALLIACGLATFLENALIERKLNRKSTLTERLRFSLWSGALAFFVFFALSYCLLALSSVFANLSSAAQVPIHNFWVFMTSLYLYGPLAAVVVMFILCLAFTSVWSHVGNMRAASASQAS